MASSSSGTPQSASCPSKPSSAGPPPTAAPPPPPPRRPPRLSAFDILQADGLELLSLPYRERRRRLEVLFAARALTVPWTLCPMTTDPDKALEWLEDGTDVSGVEGILIKNMNQCYRPGARDRAWTWIRRRNTTEAVIGAIAGTPARPQPLVLGRPDPTGRLRPVGRPVGRSVPLRPDAARRLAEHLTPAGPGHPWTGAKFAAARGTRDVLDTTLVQPDLVAEISADTAVDRGGVYRHPIRFVRLCLDASVDDVPWFGGGRL
nr:ATP-dependent DNA ligase [Streptomyces xanthophaeus]